MAVLSSKKTRQSLLKKGFEQLEGDHHYFVYRHGGKIVLKTKISHNDQDITDGLISKMYRQCHLNNKKQFLDLIDCPLSQEGYEIILGKNEIIPLPPEKDDKI